MVLNHYKESRNHQESSHQLVHMNRQKKIEIQSNEAQDVHERDEFQNPGGHKEGRASFPDQITYKVFTNPWLKSLTLDRREEGQRGEGRQAQGEEGGGFFWPTGERKGVRGYLRCPRRGPKYP